MYYFDEYIINQPIEDKHQPYQHIYLLNKQFYISYFITKFIIIDKHFEICQKRFQNGTFLRLFIFIFFLISCMQQTMCQMRVWMSQEIFIKLLNLSILMRFSSWHCTIFIISVSYTHLDVYKRQILSFSW